jgi:hypothetical protein
VARRGSYTVKATAEVGAKTTLTGEGKLFIR